MWEELLPHHPISEVSDKETHQGQHLRVVLGAVGALLSGPGAAREVLQVP